MALAQALLYVAAVILLALAALGVSARVRLVTLAWACFILAFALPTIRAGL